MDLPARELPKRDICLNLSRLNWVAVLPIERENGGATASMSEVCLNSKSESESLI